MSKNFTATRAGLAIAVTTASVATQLNTDLVIAQAAPDVLIDNRGAADCYIRFGAAGDAVTVATGVRIPAGAIAIYGKASASHIAVIGDAATSLVVHLGEGL